MGPSHESTTADDVDDGDRGQMGVHDTKENEKKIYLRASGYAGRTPLWPLPAAAPAAYRCAYQEERLSIAKESSTKVANLGHS